MTIPEDESHPNKVQPSNPGPAAEGPHQEEKPGESHPEEDPAEGSRETIDREFGGEAQPAKDANDETERAHKALQEQVEEDAELLQRGSA